MALDTRKDLLVKFSQVFFKVIKLINMSERNLEGSYSNKHFVSRHLSISLAIDSIIESQLGSIPQTGDMAYCKVNRRKALIFQEEGNIDHDGKQSIFGQIMQSFRMRDGSLSLNYFR